MEKSPKKFNTLAILTLLQKYGDQDHPLTQQRLIELAEEEYKLFMNRKTVSDCLHLLDDMGFSVGEQPKKGFYLSSPLLPNGDCERLIEAIFLCQTLDSSSSKALANELAATQNVYHKRSYDFVEKAPVPEKKATGFEHLEIIEEAISKKKQLSFQYLSFDKDGTLKPGRGGFRYKVSPYYVLVIEGVFYLFSNQAKYKNTSRYRLDRLLNLQIEPDDISPLSDIDPNFDLDVYFKENSIPGDQEVVEAEILLTSSKSLEDLASFFPRGFRIIPGEGKLRVLVTSSTGHLLHYGLTHPEAAEILSPASLREELKQCSSKAFKLYKK